MDIEIKKILQRIPEKPNTTILEILLTADNAQSYTLLNCAKYGSIGPIYINDKKYAVYKNTANPNKNTSSFYLRLFPYHD